MIRLLFSGILFSVFLPIFLFVQGEGSLSAQPDSTMRSEPSVIWEKLESLRHDYFLLLKEMEEVEVKNIRLQWKFDELLKEIKNLHEGLDSMGQELERLSQIEKQSSVIGENMLGNTNEAIELRSQLASSIVASKEIEKNPHISRFERQEKMTSLRHTLGKYMEQLQQLNQDIQMMLE